MGKIPLTGLIGACSLGLLLTGCNCCNRNTTAPYAGGRAERSMGLLSNQRTRNPSTTIPTPIEDGTGKSLVSPSSAGADTSFIPRSNSSASSAGMTTPSSTGSMTPMSNSSALPSSSNNPAPPTNTNGANPAGLSGSMSRGSSVSPMSSSVGSNSLSSSPIQQVGNSSDNLPPLKTAAYSSADSDGTPHLPTKGPGRVIPAPPPTTDTYSSMPSGKTSSTSTKRAPSSNVSPLPPPLPPPSDNTNLPSDPPLNTSTTKSTSNLSGPGSSLSKSSSSPSLPDYLK